MSCETTSERMDKFNKFKLILKICPVMKERNQVQFSKVEHFVPIYTSKSKINDYICRIMMFLGFISISNNKRSKHNETVFSLGIKHVKWQYVKF